MIWTKMSVESMRKADCQRVLKIEMTKCVAAFNVGKGNRGA